MDRRNFIRLSAGAAGTLCFPLLARGTALPDAAPAGEPHFFFQILLQGGLDPTYLFDARPLALTQAGIVQNYLAEEPTEWAGAGGGRTLATRLAEPLKPYRDRFSVLNGVVMATGFDGHDQNMNYLLTGDPFGGESFVPHLNRKAQGRVPAPLDALTSGILVANLTNAGASVPLSADSATKLVGRLRRSAPLSTASPLYNFILGRMAAAGAGGGAFSAGARAMSDGYAQAPGFASMLDGVQIAQPAPGPSPAPPSNPFDTTTLDPRFVDLALQLFKQGVTRTAVFSYLGALDAHNPDSAKKQPQIIGSAVQLVATLFKQLAATPYDSARSMLDVTTVMVASEFGRTLRQKNLPIDATGTDHNPLSNTILLGGKGIVGGQVIGESDTRAAGETLSKVHLAFDPESIKVMGKPFDFATGKARADLPATYNPGDYLGMSSVANTVYKLFGVAGQNRKLMRDGADAPVIRGLLA